MQPRDYLQLSHFQSFILLYDLLAFFFFFFFLKPWDSYVRLIYLTVSWGGAGGGKEVTLNWDIACEISALVWIYWGVGV